MAINPANITTIRVDQLANVGLTLDSLFPHTVGTELTSSTIESLVTLVASAIGSTDAVGFLPISVTDGQQLPDVPTNPGFFLCGAGTYLNINGFGNLICTEALNAIMSVDDHWEIAVQIPVTPLSGTVQTVTGSAVDNTDPLNPIVNLGSSTTPTLQEVTTEGNLTTNTIEINTDEYEALIFKANDDIVGLVLPTSEGTEYRTENGLLGQSSVFKLNKITNNGTDYPLPNGVSSQIATLADITGGVSDGDKGDITVSSSGTVWTIDNGLDATKIADGSVSNTEFQYINSLTANAQTQIDLKQTNFHKDAVTSSAITGVTANTILISCLVPANTFAVGTVAEVRCNIQRSGGNGTATYRMYTNTSNSLSGASQLGTYNNTATQLYTPFKRLFAFKTGNVIFGAGANSTLLNDEVVSTVAPSSNTFDTTVDNWIIIAVQPANGSDSFTSELFTIKGNR